MAEDFEFIEAEVNAIGLFDVIEHIEDDNLFLKNLVEKTSPNTTFYIATPSYSWLWNDMDKIGGHFRRYNKKSLLKLGQDAGLEPLYFTYYFSYLVPPYFLFRIIPYWLGRKSSEEELIAGELKAHKLSMILEKLFYPFHFMESLFIKKGLTIPFGSSCMAVFRKK